MGTNTDMDRIVTLLNRGTAEGDYRKKPSFRKGWNRPRKTDQTKSIRKDTIDDLNLIRTILSAWIPFRSSCFLLSLF